MQTDSVTYHRIWSETDRRLNSLAAQVREGVSVDEASNFTRWLRFSGVLELLAPFEQDIPLPVHGGKLALKCEDLIFECGQWYSLHERSNKPRDAYISLSKLESLESEMRSMREQLFTLSRPLSETTEMGVHPPVLHVIQGAAI